MTNGPHDSLIATTKDVLVDMEKGNKVDLYKEVMDLMEVVEFWSGAIGCPKKLKKWARDLYTILQFGYWANLCCVKKSNLKSKEFSKCHKVL